MVSLLLVGVLTAGCFGFGEARRAPYPSGSSWEEKIDRKLLKRANADRGYWGLPPLSWNALLGGLSADWSEHMATSGQFEHRDLTATINSPPFAGFERLGENILVGGCGMSAREIHTAWMNSPGHRANIMSPNFNVFGAHVVCGQDGRIWATENFGLK